MNRLVSELLNAATDFSAARTIASELGRRAGLGQGCFTDNPTRKEAKRLQLWTASGYVR
jgi:hypothetical protein